jgi:hypothetical protein
VITLYGTIFASTAAHSRVFADMARLLGFFARDDHERRVAIRKRFVYLLTLLPAAMFLVFASPVKMVVWGGLAQSALLPLLGFAALHLHHRHLPKDVRPGPAVTAGLWLAALGMSAVTGYSLVLSLR